MGKNKNCVLKPAYISNYNSLVGKLLEIYKNNKNVSKFKFDGAINVNGTDKGIVVFGCDNFGINWNKAKFYTAKTIYIKYDEMKQMERFNYAR